MRIEPKENFSKRIRASQRRLGDPERLRLRAGSRVVAKHEVGTAIASSYHQSRIVGAAYYRWSAVPGNIVPGAFAPLRAKSEIALRRAFAAAELKRERDVISPILVQLGERLRGLGEIGRQRAERLYLLTHHVSAERL